MSDNRPEHRASTPFLALAAAFGLAIVSLLIFGMKLNDISDSVEARNKTENKQMVEQTKAKPPDMMVIAQTIVPVIKRASKQGLYDLEQQILRQTGVNGADANPDPKIWIDNPNERVHWYTAVLLATNMVSSDHCKGRNLWIQLRPIEVLKYFRDHAKDPQPFRPEEFTVKKVVEELVQLNPTAYTCT